MSRHKGLKWAEIEASLKAQTGKLWSLHAMEGTGGEPDVVGQDAKTGEYLFLIVQRKVRKVAQVCVMTAKDWNRGKNTNPKATHSIWLRPWASDF